MGYEFEEMSGKIVEAAVAVHKTLGPGFLESGYQKALEVALRHRAIAFDNQKKSTSSSRTRKSASIAWT